MQVTKYRWLSLLLCGTLVVSACVPIAATTPSVQETRATSPYQTEMVADALQLAYLDGNTAAYRVSLFVIYQEMRLQDIDTIAVRVGELLDYMKSHDADGLEPLLVTYIDAVAFSGNQKAVSIVLGEIGNNTGTLHFRQNPWINIAIPLERWSTPVVIDVRGDAMRQIVFEYLDVASSMAVSSYLPTLEELLNKQNTQENLCKLPLLKDQTGTMHPSDLLRQQNCAITSSPGGEQGGPIPRSIGPFVLGACLNNLPTEADTLRVRYLDAATCAAEMAIDGSYPFTGGSEERRAPELPTNPAVVGAVVAVVTIAAGIIAIKDYVDKQRDARVTQAMRDYKIAVNTLTSETNGLTIADSNLTVAKTEEDAAAKKVEEAGKNYVEALEDLNAISND
ncbi:MAG TPA: hypothetical protein PKE45_06780, partial [Caldilineaceae bacterium]|nr:hypothetical protein [Caldilineaceae bacterium]